MSRLEAVNDVHSRLLERWRHSMDLVGPGPIAPHFEDAAASVADLNAAGRWADLGSGAGFPGIALAAAWPDAQVSLVESRQKRAVFLDNVVAEAGLHNAVVLRQRAEDLAPGFDGLISRAFLPPEAYLKLARRLLAPHGVAVLLLGDRDFEAPEGWAVVERRRYTVADGGRRRVILRPAGP